MDGGRVQVHEKRFLIYLVITSHYDVLERKTQRGLGTFSATLVIIIIINEEQTSYLAPDRDRDAAQYHAVYSSSR